MSARNGHRPPRRRTASNDVVILAPSWPLLPDTEYCGTVTKHEVGCAPWAARKLRVGEAAKRRDWHVYFHVRLDVGVTPAGIEAIAGYQREHAGALPVTYLACRFTRVRPDDPIQPGRTSKLYQLLRLVAGTPLLGQIRLGSVVGQRLRVRLRTVDHGHDGTKLPVALWRSTVERLELLPPHPPATSSQQQAASKKQLPPPIVVVGTAVSDSATSMAGRASRHRSNQPASQATAPAAVGPPIPVGADAEPVLIEVNPWTP